MIGVPSYVHTAAKGRGHAGRVPPTAAASAGSGAGALNGIRSYGLYRHLQESQPTTHGGMLVTPLAETAVHTALRLEFPQAVAIVDHVLKPGKRSGPLLTSAQLDAVIAALPSAAKRRRAGEILTFADGRSESPGESFSRAQIHILGFAAPELQYEIRDHEGFAGRTDFYWKQPRLAGEFDGAAKYTRGGQTAGLGIEEVVRRENAREDRIRAAGHGMSRWTWPLLRERAAFVAHLERAGVPRRPR